MTLRIAFLGRLWLVPSIFITVILEDQNFGPQGLTQDQN